MQLFDIVLPAQIGEVVGIAPMSGSPIIGPFKDCEIFSGPAGPFSSAEESVLDLISSFVFGTHKTCFSYLRWRITATKWRVTDEATVDVPALLERLTILACRFLKHLEDLDPLLLSVRPVHLDPHDRNVLVHHGHFAGLVDWQASQLFCLACDKQAHLCAQILTMPAFMAAEFPPYLRSDGMYEDRYSALSKDGYIHHMNARVVWLSYISPSPLIFAAATRPCGGRTSPWIVLGGSCSEKSDVCQGNAGG